MNKVIKSKELIVLVAVTIADLVSKLCAHLLLPLKENVAFIGNQIFFYLTYNESSTGGQADALLRDSPNKNLTLILVCIAGLILLGYILFIRKRKLRIAYKILIGIGIFAILNIVIDICLSIFSNLEVSSWITSVIGKLTGLSVFCVAFYFTKDKWLRLFLITIITGGVGNLISHFYPPFKVIDFIYVEGLYEIVRIGVFNLADLAVDIGVIGLVVSVVIKEFIKLLKRG